MTRDVPPPPPQRELPSEDWEHAELYRNVREAITGLPIYFRTETHISGVLATDLHTLNAVWGVADGGHNFGRLARTGLMDDYKRKLDETRLCGIKTTHWRDFLKAFQDNTTDAEARSALERLKRKVERGPAAPTSAARTALAIVGELEALLAASEGSG